MSFKRKCKWCGLEAYECADGTVCHANVPSVPQDTCELWELRKLRDELIAVARKVGSGMPMLSDHVVARANWLASLEDSAS